MNSVKDFETGDGPGSCRWADAIRSVLMRGRQEVRGKRGCERLALKREEGAGSQGVQATSRRGTRRGHRLPLHFRLLTSRIVIVFSHLKPLSLW